MNKLIKIVLAVLGAINVVFGIFIPIAVALLYLTLFNPGTFYANIIIVAGSLASFYRAISVGFIQKE